MKTKKIWQGKFCESVNFVKPLYKTVKFRNTVNDKVLAIKVGSKIKLDGDALNIIRRVNDMSGAAPKSAIFKPNRKIKPFANLSRCPERADGDNLTAKSILYRESRDKYKNVNLASNIMQHDEIDTMSTRDQMVQTNGLHQKAPNCWLRVHPAPPLPGEGISSILLRCLLCQLGLLTFLLLWTVAWDYAICAAEEPNERAVSAEYMRKQNQLVIDLATELRQIDKRSEKWREAIQRRVESQRHLTELAVGCGARHDPGRFWDLPGTFLFTVYIMTAIGFGAPVPHTMFGRSSALIYATIAIPTHVYLMVNACTCIVAKTEKELRKLSIVWKKTSCNFGKSSAQYQEDSPSCSDNAYLKKKYSLRTSINVCIRILSYGRCMPLVITLYYTLGVFVFGYARGKSALDTIMFPVEFTTTGGLEMVEGYIRIIYAIYIEGAVLLLTCALQFIRRNSNESVKRMTDKYRLFCTETQTLDN